MAYLLPLVFEFETEYNRRTGADSAGSFPRTGLQIDQVVQIHEYAIQGCKLLWRTTNVTMEEHRTIKGAAISYHRYLARMNDHLSKQNFDADTVTHFDKRKSMKFDKCDWSLVFREEMAIGSLPSPVFETNTFSVVGYRCGRDSAVYGAEQDH